MECCSRPAATPSSSPALPPAALAAHPTVTLIETDHIGEWLGFAGDDELEAAWAVKQVNAGG